MIRGGGDLGDLPPGSTNESSQWRLIGTTGGQASVPQPPALTLHDFNGDGKADLVWRNSDTSVAVWLLNGTGLIGADFVSHAVDSDWQLVGGGDVDGNGKADLVWRQTPSGQVAVWLLNGTTLLGAALVGSPVEFAWQIVGVGDVDGNGKADLVWRHALTSQVAVWLFNSPTSFSGLFVGSPIGFDWELR